MLFYASAEVPYCPVCENDIIIESPSGFWKICTYCAHIWNNPALLNQIWTVGEKALEQFVNQSKEPTLFSAISDSQAQVGTLVVRRPEPLVSFGKSVREPHPWDTIFDGDGFPIYIDDPGHPEHENWLALYP